MEYIKGKIRSTIFSSDTGFFVGTFKIKETNDESLEEKVNKTITITGIILEPNEEESYILYGEYIRNERYGYQYKFSSYEKIKPEGKDAIIEFLSSNLIKGCGQRSAKQIVDTLGEKALDLIKEDKNNLLLVPNMTEARAIKIYDSLIRYSQIDDILIELKKLGFTINEATSIVKKFGPSTTIHIKENLYCFKDIVPFAKLDRIFKNNHDLYDLVRIKECTIEAMETLSETNGDTYYLREEIVDVLKHNYQLTLTMLELNPYLELLENEQIITIYDDKIILNKYQEMEKTIAKRLYDISNLPPIKIKNYKDRIKRLEEDLGVFYNANQEDAIYNALTNRVTIISGGPGTGKTTIINAITRLYIEMHKLSNIDIASNIALVAPTGRASKKLALSTSLKAMTIHRYLKWNKETDEFQINEFNKNIQKLIIVDETSMIDSYLFSSLLKGINDDIQLILVGDTFQLPSVKAGNILADLVKSEMFSFCPLNTIYRQSENSYIPILAQEIKEKSLSENVFLKKDDYNFVECSNANLKDAIKQICEKCLEKKINIDDIQILAPMYKGENGIDNLNELIQGLMNKKSTLKKEVTYFDVTFRENDKVLQLVNNPDCNVYNGDIGHIINIKEVNTPKKNVLVTIDFDGNLVTYKKEELNNIKHAYAMTIHKSQGSEFKHVILPISKNYHKMLYNKLIYTGVSRAKNSLIIVGDKVAFLQAVNNDYAMNRKTLLYEKIMHIFNE